jgi:hypothetical protein
MVRVVYAYFFRPRPGRCVYFICSSLFTVPSPLLLPGQTRAAAPRCVYFICSSSFTVPSRLLPSLFFAATPCCLLSIFSSLFFSGSVLLPLLPHTGLSAPAFGDMVRACIRLPLYRFYRTQTPALAATLFSRHREPWLTFCVHRLPPLSLPPSAFVTALLSQVQYSKRAQEGSQPLLGHERGLSRTTTT